MATGELKPTLIIIPLESDRDDLFLSKTYQEMLDQLGRYNTVIKSPPHLTTPHKSWTDADYAALAEWAKNENAAIVTFGSFTFGKALVGFLATTGKTVADSRFYEITLHVFPGAPPYALGKALNEVEADRTIFETKRASTSSMRHQRYKVLLANMDADLFDKDPTLTFKRQLEDIGGFNIARLLSAKSSLLVENVSNENLKTMASQADEWLTETSTQMLVFGTTQNGIFNIGIIPANETLPQDMPLQRTDYDIRQQRGIKSLRIEIGEQWVAVVKRELAALEKDSLDYTQFIWKVKNLTASTGKSKGYGWLSNGHLEYSLGFSLLLQARIENDAEYAKEAIMRLDKALYCFNTIDDQQWIESTENQILLARQFLNECKPKTP